MIEPIRSPLLSKIPNIEHGFYAANAIMQNDLAWVKQVHGTEILEATKPFGEFPPAADGVYTDQANQWVGVQTADCMPVLFASTTKPLVAAVHAGWRGLLAGILVKPIELWNVKGIRPKDIVIAIGPSIGPCCFEVSQEAITQFENSWGWMWPLQNRPWMKGRETLLAKEILENPTSTYARTGANNLWLDLKSIAKAQLVNAGVPVTNIDDTSLCTYCGVLRLHGEELKAETNEFASYRRSTHTGVKAARQWSVIKHTNTSSLGRPLVGSTNGFSF